MRKTAVFFVMGVLAFSSQGSAGATRVRGPWLLVPLAALGTVSWRCDPARRPGLAPELPGLALGFRASATEQTGRLWLRASGRTILHRVFQPGQTIELPYLRSRIQQLEISEHGEDGTLRARLTVDFAAHALSNYCWPYMPPKVTAELGPRR